MTIAGYDNRRSYAGTGDKTPWPFPIPFISNTDISVFDRDASGNETRLVYGIDYTVSGAGSPTGGVVTPINNTVVGHTYVLFRNPPLSQTTTYLDGGALPAATQVSALDKLTMLIQRLYERLGRVPELYQTDVDGSGRFNGRSNELAHIAPGTAGDSAATVSQIQSIAAAAGNVPAPEFWQINGVLTATGLGDFQWLQYPDFSTVPTSERVAINAQQRQVWTAGYLTAGDGGAGLYKRVNAEPSHEGKFQDAASAWWELVLNQDCHPAQFGASPTTSDAANLTAFNDLLAFLGDAYPVVDLKGAAYTLSDEPTNPYGVRFVNGAVLVPQLGGVHQSNHYADDLGLVVGRENLAAFKIAVVAQSSITGTILGDSTAAMNDAYPEKAHQQIRLGMLSCGINKVTMSNHAVSGTSWGDATLIPYLSSSLKIAFYKYAINDAVKDDALATMAAAMDAELSAVRAHANGDLASLSIVLWGPNVTIRPSTGQNDVWYEKVRNVYVEMARKYQCVFFDCYAFASTADNAPGLWLDDIVTGSYHEGIHPTPVSSYWFWVPGTRLILDDGAWNTVRSNYVLNFSNTDEASSASSAPSGYRYGSNRHVALAVNGWPADGIVHTDVQADGIVSQELVTQEVKPRRLRRSGNRSGDVWTQWTGTFNAVTLTNSWVSAAGDGYADPGYSVGDDGFISLYGAIKSGSSGTSAFTLPTNARPVDGAHGFMVPTSAVVVVGVDGTVKPTGTTTLVCLDGIRFRAL